jgi:uncharacterized protein
MNEQPIVWLKNETQKKRLQDHKASVLTSEDGTLQFESHNIITPKGLEKTNKLISVVPKPEETILPLSSVSYLFQELKQMNLILTNACNLSCSYCYEQHNKDFGRFTNESLLSAYRFLVNANNRQKKVFNFFGGEPLIHKDIILDFVRKNEKELQENARGDFNTVVGIVTNGLLLTEQLIDEFLSYDFTYILISLDTDRSEVDHREIGQDKIDKLMEHIRYMPDAPKQEKRVTIRCTLARENAPHFTEFADNLYERGIRRMVVHPLVLDSSKGFIRWKDEEWSKLHQDILAILDKYSDMQIHFSEGVGQKGEENCMIGSDMIAIDASGDFSGCYFFTNQKANSTADTILGNLFHQNIYIDRYKTFQREYAKMFEMEEQCQSCDYKNACYQCPAGNLDTGTRMFRPDDMCQKIVKLYIDLQEDISKKQFKKKYDVICNSVSVEGENITFAKAISYLMFYFHFNYHPKLEVVHDGIYDIKDYRQLLAVWKKMIDGDITPKFIASDFVNQLESLLTEETVEMDDFYYFVVQRGNLAPATRKVKAETAFQKSFFLSLLHMIILQSMYKTYEGTFSERLLDDTSEHNRTKSNI